ncbi:ANTAR domain-containing protein [Pseudonocardia ammonioxydans]|uniref:ANTAR domain-containing protein n=1 Tax=Pseudonocardia ammonioxydans TaxID=260086 RepID=A0A1I5AUB6_PSUAM|nr:ANTAR domain-containing protein [Pseudonocardia ammonioxydans]SFN66027.1 ANTAR domain-containing protein [Pseudonocardia ammonioxydans]
MAAERVVRACVDALAVDGAALTALGHRGEFVHLAVAGTAAGRVAELQLTTGTGPCWDTVRTGRATHGPDLGLPAAQARWPGFAATAAEDGVRAVFAFPLPAGAACCGTLLLCRYRPGNLTADQICDALGFAEAALWTLLDHRAGTPADQPPEPLGGGQDRIFQASGMIAAQLDTGVDEALTRLRAHAWAANRSLTEAAADVLARRRRFTGEPG